MTHTHPVAPISDWRSYAAEIRAAILAKEAARPAGTSLSHLETDISELCGTLPDERPAPDPLTARQTLLVLGLAASFGSRAALAAELERGAIITLTDVRSDLVIEVGRLLRWVLPNGFFIAKADRDRHRPGAVTVVKSAQPGWLDHEQLRLELTAALEFPAPVILLLPEGLEAMEILGEAETQTRAFRVFEREIIAEFLAQSYPATEPAALLEHLPPEAQLAETPMLWLMLALRCDCAEAAARLLARRDWPTKTETGEERRGKDPSFRARASTGGIPLAELAGLEEARDIAIGITEDLRAWAAGALEWRDVHRGLLVAGPPGCGKTELARAMAREPGIHLESGSYAQWQAAGHMGDMLKAMRKSFARATERAPSIIFIDEIDAFGSRSNGRTSSNASYEQKVITGLLELLDGIAGREGVVVIGACNDAAELDPAIRRAGRFDQFVHIRRPDAAALATILRQHLGNDLPDADLSTLGQMAVGRSGADCAAAVRAARATARRAGRPLAEADLRADLARITWRCRPRCGAGLRSTKPDTRSSRPRSGSAPSTLCGSDRRAGRPCHAGTRLTSPRTRSTGTASPISVVGPQSCSCWAMQAVVPAVLRRRISPGPPGSCSPASSPWGWGIRAISRSAPRPSPG
ncbi:ATP-binding protein [Paracoccus sp. Z118]|nr:ATP-binding protein [Paracoccus sp. Z118]